jgi:solute carrier family 25 phosphate transporter 23/24/25/41
VQFFAFEKFKKRLVQWKKTSMGLPEDANVVLNPLERLVAGGFAGMIASSMVYPIEVVKTMLTMYPGKYPGIVSAFRGVLAEVGPKGLYAGLAPTLVAMFPYVGIEFMIYETSKIAIEAFMNKNNPDGEGVEAPIALPIIISLLLGALAGAVAQTSAHPLDVVRKRLQVQGINGNPVIYKNTFDCIAGLAKKEGMGALYKGLGPACVATIPGTAIAYITYEMMKKHFSLSSV